MPEHIALKKVESTLHGLIDDLREEQQIFRELGYRLRNGTAKQFFLRETQVRAGYAAELENELHRMGVHDVQAAGSPRTAKARIVWTEIKATLTGDADRGLLAAVEEREDEAKKVYADALRGDLPLPLREMLDRQQVHIQRSRNNVKALRDKRL